MSIIPNGNSAKVTVPELLQLKSTAADSTNKKKITCLTAYDYPTARLMDEAGVDVVLVGDSVAMVVLGYESTLPLTMEESLHHTKAAWRAAGAGGGGHAVWHVPGRREWGAEERGALRERGWCGSRESGRRRAATGSDCAADGSGNPGDGSCGIDAAVCECDGRISRAGKNGGWRG